MNCHKAKESISLFLDERLGPEEQARLNRHLEDCPDCTSYLEDLRQGLAMLRAEGLERPSDNFEWNLKRKIQRAVAEKEVDRRSARIGRREWGRFAFSAAAALLVVVVGGRIWLGSLDGASSVTPMAESGSERTVDGPQGRPGWIETGPSDLRPVADRMGAGAPDETAGEDLRTASPADSLPSEEAP
jgi:anti-sigma factor RsiW